MFIVLLLYFIMLNDPSTMGTPYKGHVFIINGFDCNFCLLLQEILE